MKPIKILGLAALAALMTMAWAGATSVMAANEPTALCSTDPGTGLHAQCPEANLITHVHETTLEGEKAKLLSTFLTVECDVLFLGDTLNGGLAAENAALIIHGNLTYTNCGGCTVTETSETVLLEVRKLGHEHADVTYEGQVFVDCGGSSLECEYDGENLKALALGPLLATGLLTGDVELSEQEVHKTGGGLLCPKISKLDLRTHPLTHTYITEWTPEKEKEKEQTNEPTALCSTDPGTGLHPQCPEANLITHVHETTLEGEQAKLLSTFLTVECDVLFLGDVLNGGLAAENAALIIHGNLTYTNCGSCTVTETSETVLLKVRKLGHEHADVTYEGQVFVDCGGSSLECEYDGENLEALALGPLLATGLLTGDVELSGQEVHKTGGGLLCPKISRLDLRTHPLEHTYIVE